MRFATPTCRYFCRERGSALNGKGATQLFSNESSLLSSSLSPALFYYTISATTPHQRSINQVS